MKEIEIYNIEYGKLNHPNYNDMMRNDDQTLFAYFNHFINP